MAASKPITISGDNSNTYIGDNITINYYGTCAEKGGPAITATVSNCDDPLDTFWPRKKLDDEIKNIQRGKAKILHGTIGTGKTFAALHYIVSNKQKFAISWEIDVYTGEDSIIVSLTLLAKELGVSYPDLFQTIEQKAENENIIFLLNNVENKSSLDSSKWFQQLWNIRRSVYIIMTTNNPASLDLCDAEQLQVEKFDEALDFLQDVHAENSEEDLKTICNYFDWNILGLTAAKLYMSSKKITVRSYLKMLDDKGTAKKVRQKELGLLSRHTQVLYESVRACLEEIGGDKFAPIAATSLVSNNMIPDFLLSNLLPSANHLENLHDLYDLHDQLKSLVRTKEENGIRFFSFHSFTQHVIRDMTCQSLKEDLFKKMAGIFVRHISKDNRFSKGDFLQRTVRVHAEKFLQELKDDKQKDDQQKDDHTLIALARLSELVGFSYTQQQPPLEGKLDEHFMWSRKKLHELCGITKEDLEPDEVMLRNSKGKSGSLFQDSGEDGEKMYDITENHSDVARQLFKKLSTKSSQLSPEIIEELVFLRTVSKQDLSLFPQVVKENQTVKEKVDSTEPLSPSDVNVFVTHGVAYSVSQYRELFLPELYLSVIYSFGRNYLYMNRATIKNPFFYIDLLKIAYCLSREISERMNNTDAVFHEFLVQANGLLRLLLNNDYFNQDDAQMKKEAKTHARDLKNAINEYEQLIHNERKFFEMGILKKTKDDAFSKLVCYLQILKCYENLLSLENIDDREQYIRDGVQCCHVFSELLDIYAAKDNRNKEDLVRYSRYMNAIAEFYLSIDREEYYPEAKKVFTVSAEHAEKYDLALYHLEALVGLADVCSRIGEYCPSIRYLERCNSTKSLLDMQHQKPHIQERIRKIQDQIPSQHRDEGDGTIKSYPYFDESDEVDSVSNSGTNGEACHDDASHENFESDAEDIPDEEIPADPGKLALSGNNNNSSTQEGTRNGPITPQFKVKPTDLCQFFEEEIEKKFLESLGANKDAIKNPNVGRIVQAITDAGTMSTSVVLGIGIGATSFLSIPTLGIPSFVGAAALLTTFTVVKGNKYRNERNAKMKDKKTEAILDGALKGIIIYVAKELSRIFEYQVCEMKDWREIETLADCAVELMFDLNKDDKFNVNTLIRKVLKDGKAKKRKLLRRNGENWSSPKVFRKCGLLLTNVETESAQFIHKVKPGCKTTRYGYRGEFLEFNDLSERNKQDEKASKEKTAEDEDETHARQQSCKCSSNDKDCTSGRYFWKSDIDSEYTDSQDENRPFSPTRILIKCPEVLNSFSQLGDKKPSLTDYLKNKLNLNGQHQVCPVYRPHSPGKVPDLQKSDLSGSDFSYCDFSDSSLEKCIFTNCVMLNVTLARARMQHSEFCRTYIYFSNLEDADANSSNWTATKIHYSHVERMDIRNMYTSGGVSWYGSNVDVAIRGREAGIDETSV